MDGTIQKLLLLLIYLSGGWGSVFLSEGWGEEGCCFTQVNGVGRVFHVGSGTGGRTTGILFSRTMHYCFNCYFNNFSGGGIGQ